MSATVLIYQMEEDRRRILEGLCRSMEIRPVFAEEKDRGIPIGLLSGSVTPSGLSAGGKPENTENPENNGDSFEEMIVMCGFTKTQFDTFLDVLKMAGLKIRLKAVETPYNRYWSGGKLQEELSREAEAVREQRKGQQAKGNRT